MKNVKWMIKLLKGVYEIMNNEKLKMKNWGGNSSGNSFFNYELWMMN